MLVSLLLIILNSLLSEESNNKKMDSFHLFFIPGTLDYRESYFSSAEVVNTGSIVLLLSYYCPTGSSLGGEKEGSGIPGGCAGHCILFPILVIFLYSLKSCHCSQW